MPGYNNKRFAISLRDKSEYADAFENEALMDTNTGELLLKTAAGDILSYDYFRKLNSSLNALEDACLDRGLTGGIFKISPSDTTIFPQVGHYPRSIPGTPLEQPIELLNEPIDFVGEIRNICLCMDMGTWYINANNYGIVSNLGIQNFIYTYTYTLYFCDVVLYTETVTVNEYDKYTHIITSPSRFTNVTKITISSIRIEPLYHWFDHDYILNSLLLFMDYTELTGDIGIILESPPTKLEYSSSATSIDMTGSRIIVYNSSYETRYLDESEYTVTGWDPTSKSDTLTINVNYGRFTVSFDVSIPSNTWVYDIVDNEIRINRYIGNDTVVSIPTTIEGYPVTTIEATAFSYTNVTSVNIPSGVTEIG